MPTQMLIGSSLVCSHSNWLTSCIACTLGNAIGKSVIDLNGSGVHFLVLQVIRKSAFSAHIICLEALFVVVYNRHDIHLTAVYRHAGTYLASRTMFPELKSASSGLHL